MMARTDKGGYFNVTYITQAISILYPPINIAKPTLQLCINTPRKDMPISEIHPHEHRERVTECTFNCTGAVYIS